MSIEQLVACCVAALTVTLAVVPACVLGRRGKRKANSAPGGWVLLPMNNSDMDADEINEDNIVLVNSDI